MKHSAIGDEKNTHQLIRILGNILESDNINFVDFLENIFDELDRFISYIPQMHEKQSSTIKDLLSKYVKSIFCLSPEL